HFESGVTRRLLSSRGDDVLPRGWWGHRTLTFPAKEDFRDQNRMVVDLPIVFGSGARCVATVELVRATELAHDIRTYVPYTQLDFYLGGGVHVGAAGALRDLGGAHGGAFDIGFSYWPTVHHGWFFEGNGDSFGDKGVSLVATRALQNP